MDTLVVVSKVKKYIKEKSGMSTSATFTDAITSKVASACDDAIGSAEANKRKTVMDRDFNFYKEDANVDTVLVVASKIKKYIKDKSGMSTSGKAFDQLTVLVQMWADEAIDKAQSDKRKTVMDRDL